MRNYWQKKNFGINYYIGDKGMNKNMVLVIILFTLGFEVYSQTWTVLGDENEDYEYTLISKEQFNRIVKAHETTDTAVRLRFRDQVEVKHGGKLINGSVPKLNDYYYMSVRLIPKNDHMKRFVSFVRAIVVYGNTKTGKMGLEFFSTIWIPGTISLEYNWNEYSRQYNQLIKLVNGK
jgi:hypothetical protein